MSELIWLITGTSSGFGNALVLEVLRRGDRVIATTRRAERPSNFPDVDSEELKVLDLDLFWDAARIQAVVDQAASFWGRIDVLVNNAGYLGKGLAEEAGTESFRKQFQANFFGIMDTTNSVLPYMRNQRGGTIVMMGSRSAWAASEHPGIAAYASSKAALHAYSETLSTEVAQFGIRVLIPAPASFVTNAVPATPMVIDNPISDYDEARQDMTAWISRGYAGAKGDPVKAMKLVVDIVKDEGEAKGRSWPFYLLLGELAHSVVQAKTRRILQSAEEWQDLTLNVNID